MMFTKIRELLGKYRYPNLSFAEQHLSGYWDIGPITIYGENAMHWAVNIKSRWGYICFRLPFRCFGRWWPLYFYISKNANPRSARFIWPKSQKRGE